MTKLLVASTYGRINRREDRGVEVATGAGRPTWDAPFTDPLMTLFDGPKTAPGVYDSAGAWSPDGKRIAERFSRPSLLGAMRFSSRPAGDRALVVRGIQRHDLGDRMLAFLYRPR